MFKKRNKEGKKDVIRKRNSQEKFEKEFTIWVGLNA